MEEEPVYMYAIHEEDLIIDNEKYMKRDFVRKGIKHYRALSNHVDSKMLLNNNKNMNIEDLVKNLKLGKHYKKKPLWWNKIVLAHYFVSSTRSSQYTVEEYELFLLGIASDFIKEMYGVGARKISITGLPPMGCFRLIRFISLSSLGGCWERYNDVAKDFNYKLDKLIVKLNRELNGINIVTLNTYDIVLDIIQKPFKYGFEKVDVACCGSGRFEMSYLCSQSNSFTSSDANKYVFWDSFHPTEKTNFIVADYAMKSSLAQFI